MSSNSTQSTNQGPTAFGFVVTFLVFAFVLAVFFKCTLPGFLHVTGVRKDQNLTDVCLLFGILFGISMLLGVIASIHAMSTDNRQVAVVV